MGVTVALFAAVTPGGCRTADSSGEAPRTHPDRRMAHRHGPPRDIEGYIARMEQPERAVWQKPDEVVAALRLRPGERVADVGAGPGYFTLRFAEAVGPTGTVRAVDIEPKMLDRLREHITERNLANIKCVLAPEDDPSLPAGTIDTIVIVDTYHHFSDRVAYVEKLRRALTSAGRIVIIDFVPKPKEVRGFGPPLWMQLARETVDAEMAEAGLLPATVHTFLPEQYFVEYRVGESPASSVADETDECRITNYELRITNYAL